MNLWTRYYLAQSVDDALQTLVSAPGEARLIGGGTDLLLDLQQGRHPPVHTLVDVTQIPELNQLETRDGRLFGADWSHFQGQRGRGAAPLAGQLSPGHGLETFARPRMAGRRATS